MAICEKTRAESLTDWVISYLRREYTLDLHISKVTKKDQQRMKVAKRNALEKR